MPNWCINSEIITGPKEEIEPLYHNLCKWIEESNESSADNWGLANIVESAGFKPFDGEKGFRCRGDIVNDFELEDIDNKESKISFSSETAWAPMPEMWLGIVKKYAPNCKYYYFSEEPGMDLYISNDTEHRFFNEEIYLDIYLDPKDSPKKYTKAFGTESSWDYTKNEIITILQKMLRTTKTDLTLLIERFNKKQKKELKDKGYVYINPIIYEKT